MNLFQDFLHVLDEAPAIADLAAQVGQEFTQTHNDWQKAQVVADAVSAIAKAMQQGASSNAYKPKA